MLSHSIYIQKDPSVKFSSATTLNLHSNNCSGQNKKHFILFFSELKGDYEA